MLVGGRIEKFGGGGIRGGTPFVGLNIGLGPFKLETEWAVLIGVIDGDVLKLGGRDAGLREVPVFLSNGGGGNMGRGG